MSAIKKPQCRNCVANSVVRVYVRAPYGRGYMPAGWHCTYCRRMWYEWPAVQIPLPVGPSG